MNFLDELNPPQQEAVSHTQSPLLIIAGPGSGKTRVLTYRIAYLIASGIDPFQILALTFTNKAANEMRQRVEQIVGGEARNLFMGTFHSVFARILRVEAPKIGYPSNFTIYDTEDSKSVIKQLVKDQGLNDKLYKPNQVFYRISQAKNALISADEYVNTPELVSEDESAGKGKTGHLFQLYTKKCFLSGAMDFDDLLLKFHELLVRFPDILYKYQNKFKHLLVDEFQDTNTAQYAIIRKLADVHQNIAVVGDDAQSIYAFRGATIDNILSFQKDYPDTHIVKLEQNYRSTKKIVNAANHLIQHNKGQIAKEIWTSNENGAPIKVIQSVSDNEEGKLVVDKIFEHSVQDHYSHNDFSILYRTNAQSRAFEEALRRKNIPYRIYGGLSFYQRKEVKDLLAYLKLIVNPNEEESLRRIINYPRRGIGKTTIEKINVIAEEEGKSMWDIVEHIDSYNMGRSGQALKEFSILIKSFRASLEKQNAYDLAFHVAKTTRILQELYNDKSVEGVSRYENIQELLNGIKEFTAEDVVEENEMNNDRSLGAYLQNITLLTGEEDANTDTASVKLMTIHAAKGLEFPVVFIVGLEENLFPSAMSLYTRDELEEERRLFYVALTRAEKHLYLSWANTRYRFGSLQYCDPSRFLQELPEESIEHVGKPKIKREPSFSSGISLHRKARIVRNTNRPTDFGPFVADNPEQLRSGMAVLHQRFGKGKVKHIAGNSTENKIATISFEEAGDKKIMLKFAKLKIVE